MKSIDIKKWIFPILGVVLLIAWFFLYYRGNLKNKVDLRKRIDYLQSETRKNIPESKILEIQKRTDSLQVVLIQRRSRVFLEMEFQNLGKKIGEVVGQYGLQIVSIRPDYESLNTVRESKEEIKELPFQMELKGNFSQFTKWVDHLDALPFAVRINDFLFSKENPNNLTLRIELKGIVLLGKNKTIQDENEKKSIDTKQTSAT